MNDRSGGASAADESRSTGRRGRRSWSTDGRLLVLLVVAPLLGLVGVVAAELVPDGRIGYHLVRAEASGLISPTERSESPLGTTTDHFTECVAFGIGLGDPPGQNLISTALTSPSYVGCERLTAELDTLEATDTLAPGSTYLRYWHGYAVVTRPSLGLFGVAGARWMAFGVLVVSVAGMATAVTRRFGIIATAFLVAPAVLTTDMVIGGLSMHQSLGIATAWIGGWMALTATCRRPRWHTAGLVAALAGALNAYVDLMTTIPGGLALTCVGATLGALAGGADPAMRQTWRVTAAAVAGWSAGLVWMWASKWFLAMLVTGVDEVVDNVKEQIEFRLSGEFESVSDTPTQGLVDNVAEWWGQPLTPWVVVAALAGLGVAAWRARPGRPPWWRIAACAAIVGVPVAISYVVLNNHTQIHLWLVYRSLPLAFGGLCALVYVALAAERSNIRPRSAGGVSVRNNW